MYDSLLSHLQSAHPHLRDHWDLPHPTKALVLPNFVHSLKSATWKAGMKISANPPNNIIYFQDEDLKRYGEVSHIIDLECDKLHKGPIILLKTLKTFHTRANEFAPVNSFLEALKVSQVGHDGSFSFIPIEKVISLAA
ncbi:hypothetical protein O181_030114 [Austropuccinia psidii MF-1]|uniref:Uncharacterized protein n=1 Tax=Austropuccinia psidii MF-1 TaxID=1389203 RepID=A0A9Q3CTG6_9BASI|nr:hypothetical protein [Austropuccinia psidii MF-1]